MFEHPLETRKSVLSSGDRMVNTPDVVTLVSDLLYTFISKETHLQKKKSSTSAQYLQLVVTKRAKNVTRISSDF